MQGSMHIHFSRFCGPRFHKHIHQVDHGFQSFSAIKGMCFLGEMANSSLRNGIHKMSLKHHLMLKSKGVLHFTNTMAEACQRGNRSQPEKLPLAIIGTI
jgi:hypothetical protein